MSEKRIAVVFPGIGYHKDKPLLYFASQMARYRGYETVYIEYHDMPQKIRGDAAMMQKAAELAYKQSCMQLSDIDFSEYADVLFIGKSIGTVALARYVSEHDINARQIWYTPVEATVSLAYDGNSSVLSFIGDADPWSDVERVKELAAQKGIAMYSYPGCNHSLECDDALKNIENLQDVMKKTEAFIDDTGDNGA